MEIATKEQKNDFYHLWRNCFEDSEQFSKWLFEKRFLTDFSTYIKKDDTVVCCMQCYPLHIWVRGNVIKGAMLCGVCTDKKYRKQGLMTSLFRDTMNFLSEKGFVLAVHTPAVLPSYYSFGHFAVNCCKYIKSDAIMHIEKDNHIKEINQDFHMLYSCYDKFSQNYSGCISRTMADFLLKTEDYKADGAKIVVYEYDEKIKGYAVFYCTEDSILAVETVAENNEVYQKLIEGICCYGEGKKLSVKLPEDVCIHSDMFYEEMLEKGVAGVLDIQKLMSVLGQKKGYAIEIEDNVMPKNNGVFDLDGTPTQKEPDIKLSAGKATQLLLGYRSLYELQKEHSIEIYHNENAQDIANYYQKQKCYIVDEY